MDGCWDLINREKLEHVIYMSGAGVPLITAEELQEICDLLLGSRPLFIPIIPCRLILLLLLPGAF